MEQKAERIERKLREAFQPEFLAVIDESDDHHGHAGWREEGETHFRVEMRSVAFTGKTRLDRQRAVYAVLAKELAEGVHALALSLEAPGSS